MFVCAQNGIFYKQTKRASRTPVLDARLLRLICFKLSHVWSSEALRVSPHP